MQKKEPEVIVWVYILVSGIFTFYIFDFWFFASQNKFNQSINCYNKLIYELSSDISHPSVNITTLLVMLLL